MIRGSLALAVILGACAGPLWAQQDGNQTVEFSEMVVQDAGFDEEGVVPVSISTIVDRQELDRIKFITAEEILNRVPGMSMIRNFRIPMGGKPYTNNLVDGLPMQSTMEGSYGAIEQVNPFDIEQIEVTRGPSSVLYPSNGIGGTTNVITRKPPKEMQRQIWGEYGQKGRYRAGASVAGTQGDVGYFIDANGLEMDGWRDHSDHATRTLSGKAIYSPDDNSILTVRAEHRDVDVESPGSLSEAQYDEDWQQTDLSNSGFSKYVSTSPSVVYERGIGDEGWLKVAYLYHKKESESITSYSPDLTENDVTYNSFRIEYRQTVGNTEWIGGVDYQANDETSIDTNTSGDTTKSLLLDETMIAPFLQLAYRPIEPVRLTVGVRKESLEYKYENRLSSESGSKDFGTLVKKAGLEYGVDSDHTVWVAYSDGFMAPGTSYLFTSGSANPDLDEETSGTVQGGVRGRFENFKYDIGVYQTDIEDMIVTEEVSCTYVPYRRCTYQYNNAGEVRVKGVESTFTYRPVNLLTLEAAHTYAINEYKTYIDRGADYSGNKMAASPLHHLNARVRYQVIPLLEAELEGDYISDYYADNANDEKVSRPTLYNLRLSYDDRKNWGAWLHVMNLADTKYATRISSGYGGLSYNPGSPRTVYGGVSYRW